MISFKKPYLLFIGDAEKEQTSAKTAVGVYHWRPEDCIGQLRLSPNSVKLALPDMDIQTAVARGAKTLIVGIASSSGLVESNWIATFVSALEHGMDVASGLFNKLADIPELRSAADKSKANILDIRYHDKPIPMATGRKRSGKRLLTVGTDCCVGKMYTALAITKEMEKRDMKVDFRATGQTGIFIAESGIAFDCVRADFCAGALEMLSPDNDEDHWDIIEGQGSLFHPATGAMLALVHGSQPDVMVLCHEPTRQKLIGVDYKMPGLKECILAYEAAARITNPRATVLGISVNTQKLENKEKYLFELEDQLHLPCIDPVLTGTNKIVDLLQNIP